MCAERGVNACGVCGARLRRRGWVQHSLWPVNSSTAPRLQTTGVREVRWEVGQRSGIWLPPQRHESSACCEWSNSSWQKMTDFCVTTSDLVRAPSDSNHCKYYTMSEATPLLRLSHEMKLHSSWTGISVSSVGYVQSCPSYEITGLSLQRLNNNWRLRDVSRNAKEVIAQEGLHAECKAD